MSDKPDFRKRSFEITQEAFDSWDLTKPDGNDENYLVNLGKFLNAGFTEALEEAYNQGREAGLASHPGAQDIIAIAYKQGYEVALKNFLGDVYSNKYRFASVETLAKALKKPKE